MTKKATFLFCIFLLLGTGCSIFRTRSPVPVLPDTPPVTAEPSQEKGKKEIAKENKKRIKAKTQITEEIDSLRDELKKIELMFANKRAEGINTSRAEEIFRNSESLLKEAERLYLEANLTENYEPVLGLLQAIEDSLEKINEEIKKAPRFREKTKPQPGEFHDDRDVIIKKLGHPDPRNVRVGPMTFFSFQISDATPLLLQSRCFASMGGIGGDDSGSPDNLTVQQPSQPGAQSRIFGTFSLSSPPKIMIIEYHTGQDGTYQFVLAENDPNLSLFTSNQHLESEMRDRGLGSLCQSQGGGFENYQLIAAYKNKMAGTPEDYLEQLLSGRFRFADQFGLGVLGESAKAGASLADLELASLVFSIKIDPLNRAQHEILNKIYEGVKDSLLSSEKLQKSFTKIESWQYNFSPKKNDKKQFLNLIIASPNRKKIETLVNEFEDKLKQLAAEFNRIQKELLLFRKDYGTELVFYDDENPVMVLLLKGVGFKVEKASAETLFKKDIPELLVKLEFLYYRSKNDEQPLLVHEDQFRVNNANKYIDVSKDYQRLTSFMLGWPLRKTLPMGHYQLKLTITDKIREKAIIQEVNFTVLPANLRGKGGL